MSGTPPTSYKLGDKEAPATKFEVKNPGASLKHNITTAKRVELTAVEHVPSFAPITGHIGIQMSGDKLPAFWRRAAATSGTESLLPAIKTKVAMFQNLQAFNLNEGTIQKQLADAIESIRTLVIQNESSATIRKALQDAFIDQDILGYIDEPLKAYFARHVGLHELPSALSDASLPRKIDLFDTYEPREILAVLQLAHFFIGKELILDEKAQTFKLVANDKELFSGNVDKTNKLINFSLDDSSSEGIAALADFMASHSQGQTNVINFKTVGEPISFMMLVEELICVKHMQVGLDKVSAAMMQKLEALDKGEYPNKDLLIARWKVLLANRMTFNEHTPFKVGLPPKDQPGSYSNYVANLRDLHQEFDPYKGTSVAPTTTPAAPAKAADATASKLEDPVTPPKPDAPAPGGVTLRKIL